MIITAFESNIISTFLIRWAGQWATTLGAIFAVLIVFVAFLSIRNANEQAEKHRYQEAAKETRDRKERILDEIITWAEGIAKCGLEMESAPLLAAPDKGYAKIKQMALTFSAFFRESRRISNVVLPSWDKLHESIEELRKQLPEQEKYLEAYIAKPNKSTFKTAKDHRETINGMVDNIIDEACSILKSDID